MTDGPLAAYRARVASGAMTADPLQALAAEKLQSLHNALAAYEPRTGKGGWRERFGLARRAEDPPQGLYLCGPVGRGKSMLMDLFFAAAPVAKKRRVHFHAFMLEVHDQMHAWRRAGGGRQETDPIPRLAREIVETGWLLCFDEFQVRDIADAMILGRLFAALLEAGAVVVATSNTVPDNLYKDGLQRGAFLPFIALIQERLDVLMLDGPTDYRRARLRGLTLYHAPFGPAADRALGRAFDQLIEGAAPGPETLIVHERALAVPAQARGVARFSFADLCEAALGAADYLAIAERYHTIILAHIPHLTPERRGPARRFINLIDILYDHRVKLVCSAEAVPDSLCPAGEEAESFQRTVSRLFEMQGEAYLALPHHGDSAPASERAA
ncbi:MAG: AFG1 family ATPase [Alphaproteobacteria bacterium]|nr:AFG1 family ATPase [Alphaproteobacteria bacterium]